MAKILPAGANVNLNLGDDPMDRLVQTVDLALKVGGAFQQAQDRKELRKNNSVQELNELIDLRQKAGPYINDDIQQELDIKTQQVFEDLDTYDDPLYVIKSTVPVGTTEKYAELGHTVCHNPEFLTARNAVKDFEEAPRTIIGARQHYSSKLGRFYNYYFSNILFNVFF